MLPAQSVPVVFTIPRHAAGEGPDPAAQGPANGLGCERQALPKRGETAAAWGGFNAPLVNARLSCQPAAGSRQGGCGPGNRSSSPRPSVAEAVRGPCLRSGDAVAGTELVAPFDCCFESGEHPALGAELLRGGSQRKGARHGEGSAVWGKATRVVRAADGSFSSGGGSAQSRARCFGPAQPVLRLSHPRDGCWGVREGQRALSPTLSLGARVCACPSRSHPLP